MKSRVKSSLTLKVRGHARKDSGVDTSPTIGEEEEREEDEEMEEEDDVECPTRLAQHVISRRTSHPPPVPKTSPESGGMLAGAPKAFYGTQMSAGER